MRAHACFHCKQWIEADEAHDCWTTTEEAPTRELTDDLRDAWERLRETAADLGEQRIYASHRSIMFARRACYCFVRPKRSYLELCVFLGRALKAPQVHTVVRSSKAKVAHIIRIRHRDEVEPPITEWMEEAYRLPDVLAARKSPKGLKAAKAAKAPKAAKRPPKRTTRPH